MNKLMCVFVLCITACSSNRPNIELPAQTVAYKPTEFYTPTLYEPEGELIDDLNLQPAQGVIASQATLTTTTNTPMSLLSEDGNTQYPYWSSVNEMPQKKSGVLSIIKNSGHTVQSITVATENNTEKQLTFSSQSGQLKMLNGASDYNAGDILDVGAFSGIDDLSKSIASVGNADMSFVLRDPEVANWNYQTFVFFKQKRSQESLPNNENLPAGNYFGYQSIGVPTALANMPKDKIGAYNGYSTGVFKEGTNEYRTTAKVIVKVDFANRKGAFETYDTKIYAVNNNQLSAGVSADGLNLSTGTEAFTWGAGDTAFSTVNLKSRAEYETDKDCKNTSHCFSLSGELKGRFYGDQAAEVGGVFSMRDKDKSYIGGFGAKRK